MSTGALVAVVTLPALSATLAVAVRANPSVSMTEGAGTAPARPESASSAAQTCVTGALYQWLAFGAASGAALRFGAVLSTLMPLTVLDAELPALSRAVPTTDWFAPSTSRWGPVTVSIPESSSL